MPDNFQITLGQGNICSGIPDKSEDRIKIRSASRLLVQQKNLIPPMGLDELKINAAVVLEQAGFSSDYLPFAAVVLNNELWRPIVERIPFSKRLLLIPQCLRHIPDCPAQIDSLGLICRHCGRCVIDKILRRAEELGYASLVAEGSPVVMALIESGQIQATIGVSCLSVLERVFPYMEAGAVPGIAIPLLKDGCCYTFFDIDWLTEVLEAIDNQQAGPVNLSQLGQQVRDWFDAATLGTIFNAADGPAAALALHWMAEDGKRYRPMLTAGIYAALTGTAVAQIPPAVKQAAIAVECFHKASLIHDDIEDNDAIRYNQPTLHQQYGIPSALNAGDYLLGMGYQLLTDLDCQDLQRVRILQIAAQGHRMLCVGQGQELNCVWTQTAPSRQNLFEIFSQKTSPAFAVALKIGAVLGGADEPLLKLLDAYSDAVGIAYQIRDDLYDHLGGQVSQPLSILSVLELEGEKKAVVKAKTMLAQYRKKAVDCLEQVSQPDCKAFLRKVVTKLLDGTELMECCDEYLSDAS